MCYIPVTVVITSCFSFQYETKAALSRFEGQTSLGSADLWGQGSQPQYSQVSRCLAPFLMSSVTSPRVRLVTFFSLFPFDFYFVFHVILQLFIDTQTGLPIANQLVRNCCPS